MDSERQPSRTVASRSYWRDAAHFTKRALLSNGLVTLAGQSHRVVYESRHLRDEPDFNILAALVPGRQCIFDVGASLGATTLVIASATDESTKIIAFEASESSCMVLHENVALNGIAERVSVVNAVVAERSGQVVNFDWCSLSPQGSIVRSPLRNAISICKPTLSIDDYANSTGIIPDFVKIDVEGAERRVIEGMTETIRSGQFPIIVELHAWPDVSVADNAELVLSLAADVGYRMVDLASLSDVEDRSAYEGYPAAKNGVQFRARALLLPYSMSIPECLGNYALATS